MVHVVLELALESGEYDGEDEEVAQNGDQEEEYAAEGVEGQLHLVHQVGPVTEGHGAQDLQERGEDVVEVGQGVPVEHEGHAQVARWTGAGIAHVVQGQVGIGGAMGVEVSDDHGQTVREQARLQLHAPPRDALEEVEAYEGEGQENDEEYAHDLSDQEEGVAQSQSHAVQPAGVVDDQQTHQPQGTQLEVLLQLQETPQTQTQVHQAQFVGQVLGHPPGGQDAEEDVHPLGHGDVLHVYVSAVDQVGQSVESHQTGLEQSVERVLGEI